MRLIFKSDYWYLSKRPISGLLFVTPLWLLYEVLAFRINQGWLGSLRTGTDFLIKKSFNYFGVNAGFSVAIMILVLFTFFIQQRKGIQKLLNKPILFVFMFLESILYALVFGLIVGRVTELFLTTENIEINHTRVSALIVNIGSGVYEEFFFRFLFLTCFVLVFKKHMNELRNIIYAVGIILGSLIFAFFHYLDYFNEPFLWNSFYFRFFAGVMFSIIFINRGFGIAAFTHSLYNIFLMFRQF